MASPITSAIGLGSGLNIADIVKVSVEADTTAKQAQIRRQTNNNSAMISGIGSLRSALTAFQTSMNTLGSANPPAFNAFAGTSSNEAVVKVSANSKSVAGSYDVVVNQLATSSKVVTQKFVGGADSAISAGDLFLVQGSQSYKVEIKAGATLESVRDQINKDMARFNFSANIITDAGGSRLVVGSTTTGAGSDVSLTGIPELAVDGTKPMTADGAGYVSALAQDAELTIDGMSVKNASNKFEAISGVVMELTGVTPSALDGSKTPAKVSMVQDNEALKKSLQTFVDAYNTLQKAITGLQATSKDANDNTILGPLTNDPTTRSLLSDIRNALSEVGSGGQLTALGQLGINTMRTGELEFNALKFTKAMNEDKLGGEVQNLLTGTDGIFQRMKDAMDPYVRTGGSLAERKEALDENAGKLKEQQATLDRRVELLTASLTRKFAALDAALGKMKAQGEQITAIFSAMDAQKRAS